jgi:hypothetical protein
MKAWLIVLSLFTACIGPTEPDLGGMPLSQVRLYGDIELTFRAERKGDTVKVVADIRNTGSDSARMEFGACSFGVRGVGPLGKAWGSFLPVGADCPSIGYMLEFGPSQQRARVVYLRLASDLQSQVPDGFYEVTVYIRVSNEVRRFAAGKVRI